MPFELFDETQRTQDVVLRQLRTTSSVTYYGPNSVALADAEAASAAASRGEAHAEEAYRRSFLKASYGAYLADLAEMEGVPVADPERSGAYVVFVPEVSYVSAISGAGPYTLTISGFESWQAGDAFRIKGADDTETTTIATVIGPTSVTVAALTNAAAYIADIAAGDAVRLLFRATVPADSVVSFQGGAVFGTIAAVTTGDANPLLAGEGTALSLVDKAWCECSAAGSAGNVARMTATGVTTGAGATIRGVNRVFNPMAATGGSDTPPDGQIKYLVAHAGNATGQATARGIEALCRQGNSRVIRAFLSSTSALSTISVLTMPSNATTPLTSTEKSDLGMFLEEYGAPGITWSVGDVDTVSLEVYAALTLVPGPTGETSEGRRARLRSAWSRIASVVANYIDATRWPLAQTVSRSTLLELVLADREVTAVDTVSFLPAADLTVASTELPAFTSLSLVDSSTSYAWGDDIEQVY